MLAIIGIMILSGMFGYMAWTTVGKESLKKKSKKSYITIFIIIGFVIRIMAAVGYRGHETDMNCFTGWADTAFRNGLSQFYLSDGFHDYPPGYLYILYVLGAVKNIFNLEGGLLWAIIKLPAIIADLALGYMVYHLSSKKFSKTAATVISAFALLNPVVILNSAVWGQVDSVLALFCVIAVYLASEHKLGASFFAFAAAILIKPQAIFFAPVLVFGIIDAFFISNDFDIKKFVKTILMGLGALASVFVLFMPFGNTPKEGIQIIINQYIETIGQYKYMTVNAFNLYGLFGLNWTDLTTAVSAVGYALIVGVVILSAVVFFRGNGKSRYYLASFILVFGIFMFAPKMHERYAFPGIFMLIMLIAVIPTDKNMFLYGVFSLAQFFNIAWVLFVYETDPNVYFKSSSGVVASFINVLIFGWCIYDAFKTPKIIEKPKRLTIQTSKFRLSEKLVKLTVFDIVTMFIITSLYSCVAFYKLGNKYAPETELILTNEGVTVDLGKDTRISKTAFFLGAKELSQTHNLDISYIDSNGITTNNDIIESGSVFTWTIQKNTDSVARYVRISTNSADEDVYLKELCLLDSEGEIITPVDTGDAGLIFDEQSYLDAEKSYMSGTYFDEIYHPRTAYEFLHHMSVYEWTHPPLGKVMMGIGIMIFGMVPFGWRFMGTLLGVVMVPVVYLISRRVFKYSWLSVLGCVLFTFDFMHLAQTRLATIDTYVTLFIMLMYYYMYKYYTQSFYDKPLYKTFIPLGISGIFFGLSVASKWTGLYAGAGLAIIFFITIYDRYREYKFAKANPNGETEGLSHKSVIDSFKKNTLITLAFCVLMFIAVPFAIYALSYIPYMHTPSGEGLKTIFTNAESMLTYHGKTVVNSTHPYSSHWFEWPIMYKPIWYYSNTLADGMKQGISAFGNPAVWWLGIIAVAYSIAQTIIIPLRTKQYFGKNKYMFAFAFAVIFAVLCVISGIVGTGNDKLTRLLPCMLLYSAVIVGVFVVTMMYDYKITQTSNRIPLFLLIGYFSGYMPWMLVLRTTYIYHYFPCVIFVVLMIVYGIKCIYDNTNNKKAVIVGTAVYGIIAVGLFMLYYPVLTGQPISLDFAEKYLKWFESWVLVA